MKNLWEKIKRNKVVGFFAMILVMAVGFYFYRRGLNTLGGLLIVVPASLFFYTGNKYRCVECGEEFDLRDYVNILSNCPFCGKKLSSFNVILRRGFYRY